MLANFSNNLSLELFFDHTTATCCVLEIPSHHALDKHIDKEKFFRRKQLIIRRGLNGTKVN